MRYIYGGGAFGARLRAHIVREDGGRVKGGENGYAFRALCSGTFSVGPTDALAGEVCAKCEAIRAKWIEDARRVLRTYSAAVTELAWCSVCGDLVEPRYIRETNYCAKRACKREQQRVNQATWRAKARRSG